MARVAQVNGAATAASLGELGELRTPFDTLKVAESDFSQDEECPVCHSKRYLRKDMRFMVNPICYHKMCENCVERIFKSGMAKCPVAGCDKTLRRHQFRYPTFQDLELEREIDIRQEVAKVFNRREDEFETLRDYNDYLNDVEDITYNLIHKIDVEATRAKLNQYKAQNQAAILENLEQAEEDARDEKARQAAEQELARLRREAAVREDEESRRELREARNGVIEQLASGEGDALRIAREGQKAMLHRTRNLKESGERATASSNAIESTFTIRGLKKRQKADKEPEKPFDPFDGLSFSHDYYTLQDEYEWDELKKAKTEVRYLAGGYDIKEFYSRALCDAFSGLGVFVADELANKEGEQSKEVATQSAAQAADGEAKMDVDDPFG
jgi:CDK-activating kinase assembly factor MAT1